MSAVQLMTKFDRDPFADTPDFDAYIPRTATESTLVGLEMALRDGARVVCLDGPAGSGKTLLLRVLEERIAGDFASVRVPYPKLDPDEFCLWALSALGRAGRGDTAPEQEFARRVARRAASGERPLVLMIDDTDLLPIATLHALLRLQRSTGDAMQLVLARTGARHTDELAQAGVAPVTVELEGAMDRAEMEHYVRARLVRANVHPAERAKIEAALDRLYRRSRGNPGRLHSAAALLLCFGPERLVPALEEERKEPNAPAPGRAEPGAPLAGAWSSRADEVEAAAAPERVSIESLVAEAVAAEPPEEIAVPQPTTMLVAAPVSAPETAASISSSASSSGPTRAISSAASPASLPTSAFARARDARSIAPPDGTPQEPSP